jgi:hypothetical protein
MCERWMRAKKKEQQFFVVDVPCSRAISKKFIVGIALSRVLVFPFSLLHVSKNNNGTRLRETSHESRGPRAANKHYRRFFSHSRLYRLFIYSNARSLF